MKYDDVAGRVDSTSRRCIAVAEHIATLMPTLKQQDVYELVSRIGGT